jgi:hypothetical protein
MIKFVLILLYLYGGEVTLQQKPYASMEACEKGAEAVVSELVADPKFDVGLYGACIPLQVTEAKR